MPISRPYRNRPGPTTDLFPSLVCRGASDKVLALRGQVAVECGRRMLADVAVPISVTAVYFRLSRPALASARTPGAELSPSGA